MAEPIESKHVDGVCVATFTAGLSSFLGFFFSTQIMSVILLKYEVT